MSFSATALEGTTVGVDSFIWFAPWFKLDSSGLGPSWLLDTLNAIRVITGITFSAVREDFNGLQNTPDGGITFGLLPLDMYHGGREFTLTGNGMNGALPGQNITIGNVSVFAASPQYRVLTSYSEESSSIWGIFDPFATGRRCPQTSCR